MAFRGGTANRGLVTMRARYLWASPRRLHAPGELTFDPSGRVIEVGPCRGREVPDRAILPGLVDAHVHLQIEGLPDREVPGGDGRQFVSWARSVMARLAASDGAAHRRRAMEALRELWADGVTAVGEIDSTGASPGALREVPLAGRCYQEVIGFHLDRAGAHELLATRRLRGSRSCPAGLSPHAPYSASADLIRTAAAAEMPMQIHAAETEEEQEFLRRGTGPIAELLDSLERLPSTFRPPGVGAVAWLQRLGALGPRTTLVHCQNLEDGDVERILKHQSPVVVCPGTMEWFSRPPVPVPDWLEAGVTVALGTDSRASNDVLSMRSEMARARSLWPGLHPREVLAMATVNGAAATGRNGLGRLRRGSRADFVELETEGAGADEILDCFTTGESAPRRVWLSGRSNVGD